MDSTRETRAVRGTEVAPPPGEGRAMTSESQYVVDVMTENPVVVGPTMSVGAAEQLARARGVHYLLVIDAYSLLGVVCGCDLYDADAGMSVAQCMRTRPITIDDQQTADAAREAMRARRVGCLPVLDWCGTLRGVVTRHDLRNAGVLSREQIARCCTCGSTHGLLQRDDVGDVRFCARCLADARRPRSSIDEAYVTLGGGD